MVSIAMDALAATQSHDLYAALGLKPQPFQQAALQAYESGASGLVSVPTGSGKTLAVLAGPLQRLKANPLVNANGRVPKHRLQILLITPLKALTRDTAQAIETSVSALDLDITVGQRTGDISAYQRQKQAAAMPEVLVTTPESLSLLLARRDASSRFTHLHSVIIDEWHALMANKRGTMTELCLARLRTWQPQLQTWALSATIGDPAKAARYAVGLGSSSATVVITESSQKKATALSETSTHTLPGKKPTLKLSMVLPPSEKTLPWAGHLGLRMAGALLRRLSPDVPTLIFTNTRRQAEKWFRHLCETRPRLADRIAIHHGSLDQAQREVNEQAAKEGRVVWTVATASLDLGIDYPGIDLVVQIGSAKSIARLMQRAGRSGHRPGAVSKVLFVPTHALELVEYQALQSALDSGELESVDPYPMPLDVLAQHLVTLACGEGFRPEEMVQELGRSASYEHLGSDEFKKVLQFIQQGGACLHRYDHYKKVAPDDKGIWRITGRRMGAEHRMQIGTIVSDPQVIVAFKNRRKLGTVEESFISRLRSGDTFHFAGQLLRFDKFREQTAIVSKAQGTSGITPGWAGGTLPISPTLAKHLRNIIGSLDASSTTPDSKAKEYAATVLEAQHETSLVPKAHELLVEILDSPRTLGKARYLFFHGFAGRQVHEGLGALLALRLGRLQPLSCAVRLNDYGIVIETPEDYPFAELISKELLSPQGLDDDLGAALNMDALTRRSFRAVCRIGGLLNDGLPGAQRSRRQVQASSELLFDVFKQHEPDHILLQEAQREVRHTALDTERLEIEMQRFYESTIRIQQLEAPSPLAFPLLIESLHHTASNESIEVRIARLRESYGIGQ